MNGKNFTFTNNNNNNNNKFTKHEIKELQKKATLQTVLMSKYTTFNTGYNITCTINCKYRTARNLVCFRYVIVNTLHNNNDHDDNDDNNKYEEQFEINCMMLNQTDCAGR